jgi:hypothetical protein
MTRWKQTLGFSGLVGALAGLAMAVPAQASAPFKGVCMIVGGIEANKTVTPRGVLLVGGKGTFTFSSVNANCVGVAKNGPYTVINQTVSAAGQFKNSICGTGKAVGTVTSVGDPKLANLVNEKFAIEFVAFSGTLYWHRWNKPQPVNEKVLDPFVNQKPGQTKLWTAAGQVTLLPPTPLAKPLPELLADECSKTFNTVVTMVVDR